MTLLPIIVAPYDSYWVLRGKAYRTTATTEAGKLLNVCRIFLGAVCNFERWRPPFLIGPRGR